MPTTFRTTLCDLLGIEYPIVQSGMGSVAGPDLARHRGVPAIGCPRAAQLWQARLASE